MTPRFFIDRPVFAWVIALGILLSGVIALRSLPVEQYPDIAPPSLTIRAAYPGADAAVVESNVTQVIEQELSGVEGFRYMTASSQATGGASITVTFDPGTDIDTAQMSVQNLISGVEQRLPEEVAGQVAGLLLLSLVVIFLLLAALYESWTTPVAVLLVVPLGLLGAALASMLRGLPADVYLNVGLIAIIGLAAKNAILIVEFALEQEAEGKGVVEATLAAVKLRLRPIIGCAGRAALRKPQPRGQTRQRPDPRGNPESRPDPVLSGVGRNLRLSGQSGMSGASTNGRPRGFTIPPREPRPVATATGTATVPSFPCEECGDVDRRIQGPRQA